MASLQSQGGGGHGQRTTRGGGTGRQDQRNGKMKQMLYPDNAGIGEVCGAALAVAGRPSAAQPASTTAGRNFRMTPPESRLGIVGLGSEVLYEFGVGRVELSHAGAGLALSQQVDAVGEMGADVNAPLVGLGHEVAVGVQEADLCQADRTAER